MLRKIQFLSMPLVAFVFAGFLAAQPPPPPPGGGPGGGGGGRGGRGPARPEPPSPPAPPRDLTGVWMSRGNVGQSFTKEEPELTPWGLEQYKKSLSSNNGQYTLATTNDPVLTRCDPPGTPRVYFHPYPFEFIHTPKYTLMIFEYDHTLRKIYTDGRPLPEDPDLSWMGTSVGRWENDTTFVVDTVGLNDRTWLDRVGHRHSTQLHVIERFRRLDRDHLDIEFEMTDPKALAKTWKSTFHYQLRPNWDLGEISCSGDYLDFSKFEK